MRRKKGPVPFSSFLEKNLRFKVLNGKIPRAVILELIL
jgi:hypothetical protein